MGLECGAGQRVSGSACGVESCCLQTCAGSRERALFDNTVFRCRERETCDKIHTSCMGTGCMGEHRYGAVFACVDMLGPKMADVGVCGVYVCVTVVCCESD